MRVNCRHDRVDYRPHTHVFHCMDCGKACDAFSVKVKREEVDLRRLIEASLRPDFIEYAERGPVFLRKSPIPAVP